MILRVKRDLSGSVDGVDLTQFETGSAYSFSVSLGAFLLAIGAAEPCDPGTETATGPSIRQMLAREFPPRAMWTGPERRRHKR